MTLTMTFTREKISTWQISFFPIDIRCTMLIYCLQNRLRYYYGLISMQQGPVISLRVMEQCDMVGICLTNRTDDTIESPLLQAFEYLSAR